MGSWFLGLCFGSVEGIMGIQIRVGGGEEIMASLENGGETE